MNEQMNEQTTGQTLEASVIVMEVRTGFCLKFTFDNGAVLYSEQTYKSHDEAMDAVKSWASQLGGRIETVN